jgi:hypothetical protein
VTRQELTDLLLKVGIKAEIRKALMVGPLIEIEKRIDAAEEVIISKVLEAMIGPLPPKEVP